MCKPKTPKPTPLPPSRALAKAPSRVGVDAAVRQRLSTTNTRPTLINTNGQILRAPSAALGGGTVVLGA